MYTTVIALIKLNWERQEVDKSTAGLQSDRATGVFTICIAYTLYTLSFTVEWKSVN